MWDAVRISRAMRRHRDELFAGAMRRMAQDPREVPLRAVCTYVSESSGSEVRLMLEAFPPGTVSGLWLDLGDHEVVAVEMNTLPVHQMVILGHELWHRKEGQPGSTAGGPGAAAAARMLGDRWRIDEAVAHVAARTDYDLDEERRAERFGRLLAAKFRPFLLGTRSRTPSDELDRRIWASLEG
ncbi:toxin-antitoxin system, toxin component [Streptomyces sp. NBC_00424]|uniref:toxin-antitoxin system, toxin component n=1 Tax=Streptomyces sp. NBC_00424 TaxID=2903648 RepID=UPI00225A8754|nr:toxin-antitoxin system, toxin component [Streptomyces sp. NBC_00424]MCX5078976.1 toxin-antitoxin system, toxin component [Streptomyces sp. NBC_00424]